MSNYTTGCQNTAETPPAEAGDYESGYPGCEASVEDIEILTSKLKDFRVLTNKELASMDEAIWEGFNNQQEDDEYEHIQKIQR